MSLARRITRQPIAPDDRSLAGHDPDLPDLGPELRGLLRATAACSPYLRDLMHRERDWLIEASADPEAAFATVLDQLRLLPPDLLAPGLRAAKRRVALIVALCDLAGVWSLGAVTSALSRFADHAVRLALTHALDDEIRRGKLPGAGPDDAGTGAGMVVLAMGKLGAGELNYSSDIDLICLFDETRYPDRAEVARAAFIKVTRRMTATLSQVSDGYVFRTDLRLRPDASVTPVCLSMAAAEAYYEAEGRTWERAAYIKARPCAGDLAAGGRFLAALTPFVWRRHLDFAAIEDAHDMRLRIREHRGLGSRIAVEGHNIKLGAGGIREIEFFAQTRQLIAGGRDPSLRDPTTQGALQALAAKGWVPPEDAAELAELYRAHRELEHRLQMVGDVQTHALPATAAGVARIAAFCGQSEARFRHDLLERLRRTDQLTDGFFAPAVAEPPHGGGGDATLSTSARGIIGGWRAYPALRSDRARKSFHRLKPQLLQGLARAADPDQALLAFDGFLSGLPGGVQIFALFEANPPLVDLVVDIAATAPGLARYLARHAAVLDAVIGSGFWSAWPGLPALAAALSTELAAAQDHEARLSAARRWQKEWHFRVGVHHLRGLIDGFGAGAHYADLAEAVVACLWPVVVAELARKHGPMPGRGALVLGMGSLGAGRLHAASDLDLIVIYDALAEDLSTGPRPLAARSYYARLTQALVTALTAQMPEGRLYEVDMRLRPSGRQGPVATSLQGFTIYQETEAWSWEHLALTRARVLAGDPALARDVESFRRAVLARKGQGAGLRRDVAAMRQRLAAAKPATGPWEARNGPGRLMDIELAAATLAMLAATPAQAVDQQIAAGAGLNMPETDAQALLAAYRLCWQMHTAARLLTDRELDWDQLGEGGRAFVLQMTGQTGAAELAGALTAVVATAADAVTRLMDGTKNGKGRRMQLAEADPKGLVRESYRIEGITPAECRSIFVDWALSLPIGASVTEAARILIETYGAPDHPMTPVLTEALAPAAKAGRRGGRAARLGE